MTGRRAEAAELLFGGSWREVSMTPVEEWRVDRVAAALAGARAPHDHLTALEWLRVTHADTLSGRRIEEALAEARADERDRLTADRAKAAELYDNQLTLNDSSSDKDAIAAALVEARADERERLTADLWALAADFDANGNSQPLGDPRAAAWHKAATRLRAVVVAAAEEAKA